MSHRLEALACAALLTLAACGSSGQEAGELSALAERDQGPDHGQSAAPGAPGSEGVLEIASGEARGVGWRLYVLVASPDGVGGFLCFETTTDPHDPQSECSFAMESSFGDPPPLGFPSRTEDPLFAYGSLGQHVARVEVELEGGKTVPAEIVGEHRAHYVAVLPQGTSPVEVVAYDPSGREVGRRPFLQDQPEGSWIEELEQHCGYTPDGGYFCEGGARGGGTSRGSRSYP